MAYRFKAKESVPEGVRRIVLEEIDSAVALLGNSSGKKFDGAVHETRKSIKKIRAVLRLLRPELGKIYRQENSLFRDIGRQLSPLRDAAALLGVIGRLTENAGSKALGPAAIRKLRSGLRQQKQEIAREFATAKTLARVVSALRSARRRVAKWPLKTDGFAAIAGGLEWSYRRGRDSLKNAQKEGDPSSFHDLRKRVKDYWYQVRLLESVWTEVMQAHAASLKELETWLGDDHNLCVLCDKLERDPDRFGGRATVDLVLASIGKLQHDLREKSLSLAHRVYAEKPRITIRNVATLWDTWQKEPASMKAVERTHRKPSTSEAA